MKTPNTKKQQTIQFEIITKLIKYPRIKDKLKHYFNLVIYSLNVQLVGFFIKELNIHIADIKEVFFGWTVLQWVINYLINYPNINNEFGYEMFEYLLSIGADINKKNYNGYNIDYYIKQITNQTTQNKLNEIIGFYKTSLTQIKIKN